VLVVSLEVHRGALLEITYSTTELVNPLSWSISAKTTHFFINTICLNNKTRNRLTEKAESSLPFLPMIPTKFEASDALLRRLMYLLLH
jgi:hypothetical protein